MEFKIIEKEELKENYNKYLALYKSCFSGEQSIEELKWRYGDNPYNEVVIAVVEYNNEWISLYATTTKFLLSGGKQYKIALGLNTMTHPNYNGQGLFVKTTKYIQEELFKKSFHAIIVFPNHLSGPIYRKDIDWKIIYEIPTLELFYTDLEKGIQRISRYTSESYNDEKDAKLYKILKDKDYLNWRYIHNFSGAYKIIYSKSGNSFFVIKKYLDLLNIVDYKFVSVRELIELFVKIQELKIDGINRITIWVSNFLESHFLFEKMGFLNNRPITYFCVNKLSDELSDNIYDFRNWHITMGDDNVY